MQEYFLPNELNVYIKEIQLIFQLSCHVARLEINVKGLYDTYQNEVWRKRNIKFDEIPDNDKIKNGSIKEKFKISRKFQENLKIHEEFTDYK